MLDLLHVGVVFRESKPPEVVRVDTGVIAAAEVYTESTTFGVMESIRLDLGYGSHVHP